MQLTAKQIECLRALVNGPRSLWDFGSTTINVLRSNSLIRTENGQAYITDAGRAWLREHDNTINAGLADVINKGKRARRQQS